VEMETATLFALASRRALAAASVLIVSDLLLPERCRIEAEALLDAERRVGELAAGALSAT
jgi:purine-nucleoside phosphorylase